MSSASTVVGSFRQGTSVICEQVARGAMVDPAAGGPIGLGPVGLSTFPSPSLSQDIVAQAAKTTASAIRKFGVRHRTRQFLSIRGLKSVIALTRMTRSYEAISYQLIAGQLKAES